MTPGLSVSRQLTHFSQSMTDKNSPVQVQIEATITNAESAASWLSSERERLLNILAREGAVLLRGLPLSNALDFDACVVDVKVYMNLLVLSFLKWAWKSTILT